MYILSLLFYFFGIFFFSGLTVPPPNQSIDLEFLLFPPNRSSPGFISQETKRITIINNENLGIITNEASEWIGHKVFPASQVHYNRYYYNNTINNIRITFDTNIETKEQRIEKIINGDARTSSNEATTISKNRLIKATCGLTNSRFTSISERPKLSIFT